MGRHIARAPRLPRQWDGFWTMAAPNSCRPTDSSYPPSSLISLGCIACTWIQQNVSLLNSFVFKLKISLRTGKHEIASEWNKHHKIKTLIWSIVKGLLLSSKRRLSLERRSWKVNWLEGKEPVTMSKEERKARGSSQSTGQERAAWSSLSVFSCMLLQSLEGSCVLTS